MLNALSLLGQSSTPAPPRLRSSAAPDMLLTPVTPRPIGRDPSYAARSPLTPDSSSKRPRSGALLGSRRREGEVEPEQCTPISKRRSSRIKAKEGMGIPPTPESLPALSPKPKQIGRKSKVRGLKGDLRKTKVVDQATKHPEVVVGPSEEGKVEPLGKFHLIQERLRYDPWRMLVAIYLLNKTTGRAANPIREEIFRRWPSADALAHASIPDLAELLYPLGLFNQRANSLIRFSQQYIQLGWPIGTTGMPLPAPLDVTVFYGAGRYASDSFRIYSPLLPGKGAPQKEQYWVEKRARALENHCLTKGGELDSAGVGIEDLGGLMSDEDDVEDWDAGVEEEEWRKVRPTDKELRRYLIWRWGIEGIIYDIDAGPKLSRARDQSRLRYLLQDDTATV